MLRRRIAWVGLAPFCALVLVGACTVSSDDAADPPAKPDVPKAQQGKQGPPAFVVGGFSAEAPAQTLMPGDETYPCFIVPLTLTGPSHVVGGGSLTVGAGMHHGNITARPKTGDGIRPCPDEDTQIAGEALDIVAGGSVLFGSSTQVNGTEWRTFPDGMGFPIGDDFEVVMRLHYLNATTAPITIQPKYEWYTIDETKVTKLLGPFIWQFSGFHIPPHSSLTVKGECNIMAPEHIVSLMPHMHALATGFTASFRGGSLDGTEFLDSPGYNPDGVIVSYDPSLDLSQGQSTIAPDTGFDWTCSWDNTYDDEIVEGTGKNEMCMAFGYAWPYEAAYSAVASDGSCLVVVPPYPKGWQPKQ
jgi:hypothetical protein